MSCPKCGIPVGAGAAECPGCGVVLAKAHEAMDRAFLRRQTLARQKAAAPPPPEKTFPWRAILIIGVLAVCAFGAWQWYTDNETSDLERLAAEVKETDGSARDIDGGRAERRMWRFVLKAGIAVAAFAVGWSRLKGSLSP